MTGTVAADTRRQVVVSGVGGQGVLFVTRLLADAAIRAGEPVLTSETHGMAQRGGTVTSHLKVGRFESPLVRAGQADGIIVLSAENLPLHRGFLKPGGFAVVNAPAPRPGAPAGDPAGEGAALFTVDADRLARETGNVRAVNMIVLGFAFSRLGARGAGGLSFCSVEDVRCALRRRMGEGGGLLASSLAALDVGLRSGKE